jgi:hypothetical protein
MKLRVGLLSASSSWEQILGQEGIPWGVVGAERLERDAWSVLIVNRHVSAGERSDIEDFLANGGAILGYSEHLAGVCGLSTIPRQVRYIINESDAGWDVDLVFVRIKGSLPRNANTLRTDTGDHALFAGGFGGGWAVVLPFDAARLMTDARARSRMFYGQRERLPSERVSDVDKNQVRLIIRRGLEYLHHAQGLPYLHVWYYPHGFATVFGFRIDTDGGRQTDIDHLYRVGADRGISMTWFLDVGSHESWINRFGAMEGQEISLHCYTHATFSTQAENLNNIRKGKAAMESAGLSPPGFSAPYGIWNPGLANAIDASGFEYSSEFSYAYDTLPLYPESGGVRWNTLQVPVHPVCVGSMLRIGYTDEQMADYFVRSMKTKLQRSEPLFFYHHPSHQRWGVIEHLFDTVKENRIAAFSLADFARWWKHRGRTFIEASVAGDKLQVTTVPANDDVWLRVSMPGGREQLLPCKEQVPDLSGCTAWEPRPGYGPPQDIRRVSEFDLRSSLGDVYNMLVRKLS